MDRHALLGLSCFFAISSVMFGADAAGQLLGAPPGSSDQSAAWGRPEIIVLGALRANPVTAPYGIMTSWKKNAVVLSGRVGTKAIHDIAVRTAIDLGYPIHDELVIDTGEAQRVALSQTMQLPWTAGPWGNTAGSAPYMMYPPPLFGRVDDPFFGFEPPLVSFPPWARTKALESQVRAAGFAPGQLALGQPAPGSAMSGPGMQPPAAAGTPDDGHVKGDLKLTVDMAGQVYLTGMVASEEDRRIIEEEARNTPGVSRVYSNLQVATQTPAPAQTSETPPPPPQPFVQPQPEAKPAEPSPPAPVQQPQVQPQTAAQPQAQPQVRPPAAGQGSAPQPKAQAARPATVMAMARDAQRLTRRVADALGRRPTLAGLPIGIQSHGDVVTLSGSVPSAYEAMLAYRTVEQTPGVREIIDQLQFQLPDENHSNPLKQKARPDDLEPYLVTQIRRHLGDIAHVDVVRLRGDVIEIRGTVADPRDQERVKAVLRSMPLLRDFHLEPVLVAE